MRNDREINPDVLGYIFEKYINQKQMGAYYTKEDITEYISKNTVIPYIFEAAEQNCMIAFKADGPIWSLLRENPGAAGAATRSVVYLIRTPRAGSIGLRQEIQKAVASVNPNLPVADVKTLQAVYERSLARTSFTLVLLAIAGGMALLLGVVGLYGVISYSVARRTREVGIRLALGARRQNVTKMFVRQGLALSGIGAICGLAAALGLTQLMRSLLFEVSAADPLTYAGASAALVLAAAIGSYIPARRATRVDPMEALRAE